MVPAPEGAAADVVTVGPPASRVVAPGLTEATRHPARARSVACSRQTSGRSAGRTTPGTLLKHHIPTKTDHWDRAEPGCAEVDRVSHSGDRADGDFLPTLNLTESQTTWVEHGAVLGKSQVRVHEQFAEIRAGACTKRTTVRTLGKGTGRTCANSWATCVMALPPLCPP